MHRDWQIVWAEIEIFWSFFLLLSGVGAMEIVAMDMKLRGMYIARQLSFHGVTFKIEEVPLSKEFEKVYDESVLLVSVKAALSMPTIYKHKYAFVQRPL